MREAMLYKKIKDNTVNCFLCAHRCVIKPGKRGICAVRENRDGTLYSLVYGKAIAQNVDPIEKKPLFHFLPGSRSFSIATVGCNLRCRHCQNYEISQYPVERPDVPIPGEDVSPAQIARRAKEEGCESVSYTYTEPTIYFEYAYDCIREAKFLGVKNVFVSNGFMSPESAEIIAPVLDADNIDLKGGAEFYKKLCAGRVEPVRNTIRTLKEKGVWLEVTTLVIPDWNDSDESLTDIAEFLCSVSADIPWHVSAFYPTWRLLDKPRTPVGTLRRAREIGLKAGLKFVYTGNVPDVEGETTFCPSCKTALIKRAGYTILENLIAAGKCPRCSNPIPGVWHDR
jgi:pyruvate formate lyase activating enzyme